MTYGKPITLTGQIVANDESCEDTEFIRITRRVSGTNTTRSFKDATTDASGRFEVTFKASKSADYRASSPAHDNCAETSSDPVTVAVKAKVSIDVDDRSPARGETIVFTVSVKPKHGGTKVFLERKSGKSFKRVDMIELDRDSRVKFSVKARWKGDKVFRARWKGPHDDHEPGTSQEIKVTTHR